MALVSVIVPVYKVEQVVKNCIESILNQTFTDFELILVDDGSPDNSGRICDEYAKKDDRVIVIHKENGGVSSARNVGIDKAKGKYICFVDSDDFVETDYLYELVSCAENTGNFVLCGFSNVLDYNNVNKSSVLLDISEKLCKTNINNYAKLAECNFISQPWNKIYMTRIIKENKLRMPENISLGEDMIFVFNYLNCVKDNDITVINEPLYNYYVGSDSSLVNKYRIDLFSTTVFLNNELSDIFVNWNLSVENRRFFDNSCFYRMENVLRNIFKKSNKDSFFKKLHLVHKVLKSSDFNFWYNKFTDQQNVVYNICYKYGIYIPILIMEKF